MSALVLLAVVATAAALVRLARARSCSCQRDDPLAGLGALGTVTARVRRGPTRPSPSVPARSTRTTEEHPWR